MIVPRINLPPISSPRQPSHVGVSSIPATCPLPPLISPRTPSSAWPYKPRNDKFTRSFNGVMYKNFSIFAASAQRDRDRRLQETQRKKEEDQVRAKEQLDHRLDLLHKLESTFGIRLEGCEDDDEENLLRRAKALAHQKQDQAAVVIQAHVRRYLVGVNQRKEMEKCDNSARTIQRRWRKHEKQMSISPERTIRQKQLEMNNKAQVIQRFYRKRRRQINEELLQSRSKLEQNFEYFEDLKVKLQQQSATTIQISWRYFHWHQRRQDLHSRVMDRAARKIQAAFHSKKRTPSAGLSKAKSFRSMKSRDSFSGSNRSLSINTTRNITPNGPNTPSTISSNPQPPNPVPSNTGDLSSRSRKASMMPMQTSNRNKKDIVGGGGAFASQSGSQRNMQLITRRGTQHVAVTHSLIEGMSKDHKFSRPVDSFREGEEEEIEPSTPWQFNEPGTPLPKNQFSGISSIRDPSSPSTPSSISSRSTPVNAPVPSTPTPLGTASSNLSFGAITTAPPSTVSTAPPTPLSVTPPPGQAPPSMPPLPPSSHAPTPPSQIPNPVVSPRGRAMKRSHTTHVTGHSSHTDSHSEQAKDGPEHTPSHVPHPPASGAPIRKKTSSRSLTSKDGKPSPVSSQAGTPVATPNASTPNAPAPSLVSKSSAEVEEGDGDIANYLSSSSSAASLVVSTTLPYSAASPPVASPTESADSADGADYLETAAS
eukprot:GILI01007989.1.p1 GENE.GILI01007989.1~~GILI01007989.1.p1  ORF type:complete len:707 (+),score=146.41 GILI01007989.1:121-2241(+)